MLEDVKIVSFGPASDDAWDQLVRCLSVSGGNARGVLCADHHKGYGMPIGGVVASTDVIMPAGVGYDIGCGNMAVETNILARDVDVARVMDEIARVISFGVGRANGEKIADHPVFDAIAHADSSFQRSLLTLAKDQLGTVGSGNHYVDLFESRETGRLWVGVHFGSRGFGHKTATHFLELTAQALNMPPANGMDDVPLALPMNHPVGVMYLDAMKLAGQYAYAGREWVVSRVLRILHGGDGPAPLTTVHNHHNFAWIENHDMDGDGISETYLVTRKGATPSFPGQRGFVGGSMGDDAVIIEGVESPESARGLYSAMHGAGRVMGRKEAAGVWKKGVCTREGKVDWSAASAKVRALGVELRGAGADEAPEVYKRLPDVIAAHGHTIRVLQHLRPIGVAMAGAKEFDPYKD